ncbi:disease resistance RPP13-like protein 4 [Senna tora]|uniref:Disease resistance RPP13-like protein 4 n=1 Tax=Senna tora TaxID=362788 RepID=A0A834XES8_9FABA|nr:disease resistance RPP13-like protein 4 [Senna tora]
MSIRTNPEKAIPLLLKNLTETVQRINVDDENDRQLQKINEIERDLNAFADLVPRVMKWEHKFMDPFANLNRCLHNYHRGDPNSWLDDVVAEISSIKNSVSQLQQFAVALSQQATSDEKRKFGHKSGKASNHPKERRGLSELEERILADPVMKNFRVSYDHLEIERKLCFLFLSIFPENAVIKKRPLIYWWIGEGLIKTEVKGEEVFQELLKRELIKPYVQDKSPIVNRCQLHPWIRYMLISVAEKSQLIKFDSNKVPIFDTLHSRRVSLVLDGEFSIQPDECKNLRTIFNVNGKYIDFSDGWLADLKKLRVLQLGCCWEDKDYSTTTHFEVQSDKFLKDLKTQKHLKYLSFRGISRITALPPSIVELVNLEILDLKACHNLEMLPPNIGPLRKLTHLDVSQCYLLESMPKGLEELTSLQVLKGFVIGNSKKTPCRIGGLKGLKKLERLSIHIGSEAVIKDEDREFDKLKDLTEVKCLKISCGVVSNKLKDQVMKQPFSFPPSLEKLYLEGIPHEYMPEWLKPSKLQKLKKLYINGGNLQNLNYGDASNWKVEILRLRHLKNLKIGLPEVKKIFPNLKYVQKKRREDQRTSTQSHQAHTSEIQEEGGTNQDFEWCKAMHGLEPARWFRKISGQNLISYCLRQCPSQNPNLDSQGFKIVQTIKLLYFKARKCLNLGFDKVVEYFEAREPLQVWNLWLCKTNNPLLQELWNFIMDELKRKSENARDVETTKAICCARGEWILQDDLTDSGSIEKLMPFVRSDVVTFDESLKMWHIATHLCYVKDQDENNENRIFSKLLSDYMLYLLVMQPALMSGVTGIGQIRFQDTCAEAIKFFSKRELEPKDEEELMQVSHHDKKKKMKERMEEGACRILRCVTTDVKPFDVKGDRSKSLLFDACRLANEVEKLQGMQVDCGLGK